MKKISITVDENDADLVTRVSDLDEMDIEPIRKMASLISQFEPYYSSQEFRGKEDGIRHIHESNFPFGEACREDLGQLSAQAYYISKGASVEEFNVFAKYLPECEYGFHSIENIEILNNSEVLFSSED